MATPLNIDTTREDSDSRSATEAPIESSSPVIKASAKIAAIQQSTSQSRLNRTIAAQSVVEKNFENSIFELESGDLELLE